jgi:hypothetical protein
MTHCHFIITMGVCPPLCAAVASGRFKTTPSCVGIMWEMKNCAVVIGHVSRDVSFPVFAASRVDELYDVIHSHKRDNANSKWTSRGCIDSHSTPQSFKISNVIHRIAYTTLSFATHRAAVILFALLFTTLTVKLFIVCLPHRFPVCWSLYPPTTASQLFTLTVSTDGTLVWSTFYNCQHTTHSHCFPHRHVESNRHEQLSF